MKMLVDKDALAERIAGDPDAESEARGPAVAAMTPEERMRAVYDIATGEMVMSDESGDETEILGRLIEKHGAAAIRAAVEKAERESDEMRADRDGSIRSAIEDLTRKQARIEDLERKLAEAERVQRSRIVAWLNRKPPHAGRDHHEDLAILADQIHEGEPEAWAERTGWRAP